MQMTSEHVPDTGADTPAKTSEASLSTELAIHRTHLANERTHLAYLRTTVSLIGFGITINRFSTFLLENDQAPEGGRMFLRDTGNAGVGMVVLGLLLLLWSMLRYWRVSRDIERGTMTASHRGTIMATIGLLLMGGWTAVWLFVDK